jgi:tetratricopeptide (TPR) repeat protein
MLKAAKDHGRPALATRSKKVKKREPKKTKLEKLGFAKSKVSAGELRRALKKADIHIKAHEWQKAMPYLLQAWEAMPEDIHILTLLSQGLVVTGVRDKAIEVLERTLLIHGETIGIIGVMSDLALGLGMHDIAVKLGRKLVELEPDNPSRYVNLATALGGLEQHDDAIAMLQQVIPIFPNSADLWNVLATQVRIRDGHLASVVFFEQALSLAPDDFKILGNFSKSLNVMGEYERALQCNLRAIKATPDAPEVNLGASRGLFYKGEMEHAFDCYEYRLDKRRANNQVQHYVHKVPRWNGENLKGKSLLIEAEQGIGDEVMWSNYLPFLYERADKLYITCNTRLVSAFQRRFPDAFVESFFDRTIQNYRYRFFPKIQKLLTDREVEIDYAVPMATAPRFEWRTVEDVKMHDDGFLTPDLDLLSDFQSRLQAISDKPKVAIAWRSGMVTWDREHVYATIKDLGPLLALGDQVDFVNIQYGEVADELAEVQKMYGVTIHNFDDVDLKMDIESNLALMKACDLVISSSSAPGQFAMAVGAPTLTMCGSRLWWDFGGRKKVGFAFESEIFDGNKETGWPEIIEGITAATVERLGLS